MRSNLCFLLIIVCLVVAACGGSSEDGAAPIQGRWIGTVTYDPTSCGSEPVVSIPDLNGQDFQIEVFDSSSSEGLCPVIAIDQDERRYFLNEASPCDLDTIDEFIFAPELQEDEGSISQNPTGIVFREVTTESAQVSVAFFLNRFVICRFVGNFRREGA